MASIAGLMITTECVIADKPEEDKKMGGGMGGMGGMGGGDRLCQVEHAGCTDLDFYSQEREYSPSE